MADNQSVAATAGSVPEAADLAELDDVREIVRDSRNFFHDFRQNAALRSQLGKRMPAKRPDAQHIFWPRNQCSTPTHAFFETSLLRAHKKREDAFAALRHAFLA